MDHARSDLASSKINISLSAYVDDGSTEVSPFASSGILIKVDASDRGIIILGASKSCTSAVIINRHPLRGGPGQGEILIPQQPCTSRTH